MFDHGWVRSKSEETSTLLWSRTHTTKTRIVCFKHNQSHDCGLVCSVWSIWIIYVIHHHWSKNWIYSVLSMPQYGEFQKLLTNLYNRYVKTVYYYVWCSAVNHENTCMQYILIGFRSTSGYRGNILVSDAACKLLSTVLNCASTDRRIVFKSIPIHI